MPRLQPPLDDFEPDELDFPAFEVPPRPLSSRPRAAVNRRAPEPRVLAARETGRASGGGRATGRNRLEAMDFEDDWDEPAPPRAKPAPRKTAARPSNSSRPGTGNGARKTSRPGTGGKNSSRPATGRSGGARRQVEEPSGLTPVQYEILGICLFAVGGLLAFNALRGEPEGALPKYAVHGLRFGFGIGAQILPLLTCYLGGLLFVRRERANLGAFWRGAGASFIIILTAAHLFVPYGYEFTTPGTLVSHGGVLGGLMAYVLRRGLGAVGAVIVLVAASAVSLLLWTDTSIGVATRGIRRQWAEAWGQLCFNLAEAKQERIYRREEKRLDKEAAREAAQFERDAEREAQTYEDEEDVRRVPAARGAGLPDRSQPFSLPAARQAPRPASSRSGKPSPFFPIGDIEGELNAPPAFATPAPRSGDAPTVAAASASGPASTPALDPDSTVDDPRFQAPESLAEPIASEPVATPSGMPEGVRIEILDAPPPVSVVDAPQPLFTETTVGYVSQDDLTPIEALEAQALASATEGEEPIHKPRVDNRPRRRFGDGPLMPVYFDEAVRALDPPVPPDLAGVEEDIQQGVKAVQETLGAFKIDARVTDVKRGPVITRYEVQPAPGVRVASIANLDRDLARSLAALAVRIEAPVPGKNVVGIEVPNKKVHLVRMRDVLEQQEFLAHPSKLAFVLGKDIAGQPKWGDLTKMPHMLIAGSTNSGKSVCLNSIIASILVRASPEEVRFSLIDPKRVELTLYRGIPHLMHDVVVEPKQAVVALRRAIEEMDRRYKLFATRGVRNIASFNSKLQESEKPMPYIVIVIDELADLMMTAAAEFEKLICRLAQLARATGIHLIVATQRPSVNVITGVIKANIPARVAFAVASQVDSRTILDAVGAERLIGSGDMLYDSNNGGKSVRIQGAFLSEEEVNRIVGTVKDAYLHEDSLPEGLATFDLYSEDSDDDDFGSKSSPDEKRDDLYDAIKEFVMRHQEMSASLIQRKYEIGYPRAGRIVDQLERDGVLGPADGPKPRKVLGPGKN